MKKLLLILFAGLFIVSCTTISGSGPITSENRQVPAYDRIKVGSSIDVTIQVGDGYKVVAEDHANLLPHLETKVKDGELHIGFENGMSIMNSEAHVTVTVPSLDEVDASGSADIVIEGVLSNKSQVEFSVSGSGSIIGQVNSPEVDISISGSGKIELAGDTRKMDCQISGSGDFYGKDLRSEDCEVSVSGSGNASVFASRRLTARVSGSGDVVYGGNPASPEIKTSGSGTVKPVSQ